MENKWIINGEGREKKWRGEIEEMERGERREGEEGRERVVEVRTNGSRRRE